MNNLLILFGLAGPVSVIIALLVLVVLSQRLGAVTKRPQYYRLLYVSIGLVTLTILLRLLNLGADAADGNLQLIFRMPLAIGLTLAIPVVWFYWGWLLGERGAAIKEPARKRGDGGKSP